MARTQLGSFVTQTQADQDVRADIAAGEREYRRQVLEDTKWYDNEIEPEETL